MISVMVASRSRSQTLGEYIREILGDRSLRALATYAGISIGTASNLVNDRIENPDADTLIKIAEYLGVPVENLYKLAGYLPENHDLRTLALAEIEHLVRQLPEDEQHNILELVRLQHRLYMERRAKEQPDGPQE